MQPPIACGLRWRNRLGALSLFFVSTIISGASGDKRTVRPVLVDTSECADIANVLAGSRKIDDEPEFATTQVPANTANIVQLDQPHTIPSSASNPVSCVVKNVVLDFTIRNSETTYELLVFGNDTERSNIDNMWQRHVSFLAENQGLAIVSCSEPANEADISQLAMPVSTDFGFMIRPQDIMGSVHVVECNYAGAFCMVRIDIEGCMNSKHVSYLLPNTEANTHNWMNLVMSMTGSAAAMMNTQKYRMVPPPDTGYASSVISGLNATASYIAFECRCTNEDNLPCTLLQANAYAIKLASGLAFASHTVDDVMVYSGMAKTGSIDDNQYDINFIWYNFDYGFSSEIERYVAGNRDCPVISQKSGSTDTYRDSNGVFKVSCIICGINTHYAEATFPAPVTVSSKTMFVSSIRRAHTDEFTNSKQTTRLYFVASAATPSEIFREHYHQESVVEIGTTLTLKIGNNRNSQDPSPDTNSIITRLECDGQAIKYTRDIAASSLTFEILPAFSGKLILVYMDDPNCCGATSNTVLVNAANWKVLPAIIFPRAPSVQQQCVACAPGKFSGLSAQNDSSACIDIPVPAVSLMSQFNLPSSSPVGRRSIQSNSKPFRTYVEVNMVILNILEIRTLIPPSGARRSQVHDPSVGFAMEVWLDTTNITFVMTNAALIASSVFKIYDPQRSDMSATEWQARSLQAGQGSIMLSIQGHYVRKSALDGLMRIVTDMLTGILHMTWIIWLVFGLILVSSVGACIIYCVMSSQCHCCVKDSPTDQHTHTQESTNVLLQPQYVYHQTERTEV